MYKHYVDCRTALDVERQEARIVK